MSNESTTALKAWKVTADDAEASIIVFAPKASEAKTIGKGSDWLHDFEFTDLRATRLPGADKYASLGRARLDGDCKESARVMWELGWYQIEASSEACDICGRHEWDGVPESKVSWTENDETGDNICAGCREHEQKKTNPVKP